MPYFADEAVQSTTGSRGKTTRRKSTRTVRGCEGAWIAAVKEELKSRPPGWLVKIEQSYKLHCDREPKLHVYQACRTDTREEAERIAAEYPVGPEHANRSFNGVSFLVRVWVEAEPAK
jgi:hypothetical protein